MDGKRRPGGGLAQRGRRERAGGDAEGNPARIDGEALAWKVCLKVEIQSGTVRVKELEDGSMAYVWEALLEPCKRKGKLLRMTRWTEAGASTRCTPRMTWRRGQRHQPEEREECCGRCGKSAEYLHIIETFCGGREAAKKVCMR